MPFFAKECPKSRYQVFALIAQKKPCPAGLPQHKTNEIGPL